MQLMKRRTAIVSGPLALKMRRFRAARNGEAGLEVMTLPLMAARLAGGFLQPAGFEVLQPAVRAALDEGGFTQLEGVRALPGMARAALRTLDAVWRADLPLAYGAGSSHRLSDLALLEARVRRALPRAFMVPPDLRDAALIRVDHGSVLLGELMIEDVLDVEPVWRPLVAALSERQPVSWQWRGHLDRTWFSGTLVDAKDLPPAARQAEVCADPRAEVVEALRWVRALLSSGQAQPCEVAIASVATETWDEHMLALSRDAGLPLHFSHGVPALDTVEGQACAALADVLLRGLSQPRLRRLLRRARLTGLPNDWSRGLRRGAGLFSEAHWLRALEIARPRRASGEIAEMVLSPVLSLLAQGATAAFAAGDLLLNGIALRLWRAALQAAPPEAIELSLVRLRMPDPRPAETCITWGPAEHLAAAPRRYVRLLGLTSSSWPRPEAEDALLPNHVLPRAKIAPVSRPQLDRVLFEVISATASSELVVSRSRRSASGQLQPASRLWPDGPALLLKPTRTPEHAFSDADRLLARPEEAALEARLALSRLCWRNWASHELTEHDGLLSPAAPLVVKALEGSHSTTSLRRLLRDPLAYVWRHVLGWRSVETGVPRLSLDPSTFGELVHELLRRAVDLLEPEPSLARASADEMRTAVDAAAVAVAVAWPLERAIPPPLLWRRTLDHATRLALNGLTFDERFQAGTRSWTELTFGWNKSEFESAPWDPTQPVSLGSLLVGGRIDRLDLRAAGDAVRVTDYKTGTAPKYIASLVLAAGAELQRVVYAAAARQLLPDARQVVSRLVYLEGQPVQHALSDSQQEEAVAAVASAVDVAADLLRSGAAPPGPDASGEFNAMRLALPADLDLYLGRKRAAFAVASGGLSALWRRP